jgi:hypothetical protein
MRKQMRETKLIRKGQDWHICFKARGTIEGKRAIAWLRTCDDAFICKVGEADAIEPLPGNYTSTAALARDVFHNIIYEVDAHDNILEAMGGANNAIAARAAFEALVKQSSPDRRLSMRHGAHETGAAIGKIETI